MCIRDRAYLVDNEAYFCKQAPYRLLCPHSWKQCQDDLWYTAGETEGDQATFMLTDGPEAGYVLMWNRGKHSLHVPLDTQTNLPTIGGFGSFNGFQTFASAFHCLPTTVPDDGDAVPQPETMPLTSGVSPPHFDFSLPPSTVQASTASSTLDQPITPRDEALFMSWHIKLGHLPF